MLAFLSKKYASDASYIKELKKKVVKVGTYVLQVPARKSALVATINL